MTRTLVRVAGAFVAFATLVALAIVGAGFASATPGGWANEPGYDGPVDTGYAPGSIISSEVVNEHAQVSGRDVKVIKFTYADQNGQPTSGVLIVPNDSFDGQRPLMNYAQATDSLNSGDAPVHQILDNGASIGGPASTWLASNGAVVITNNYGDRNPTYASPSNGDRLNYGTMAAQDLLGYQAPTVCAGFSGGAKDCGHAAESSVTVPGAAATLLSGTPANMSAVFADNGSTLSSGLIMTSAAVGDYRGVGDAQKEAVDPCIRPSAKALFGSSGLGGANAQLSTLIGVVGIGPNEMFRSGCYESAPVQALINDASLGKRTPDMPVMIAGNKGDNWMVYQHNGAWLADQYRAHGGDVTTVEMDKPGWPGHQDMSAEEQVVWLNSQLPEDSRLEVQAPPSQSNPVLDVVQDAVTLAYGLVGSNLQQAQPAVHAALAPVMDVALDVADQVIENNQLATDDGNLVPDAGNKLANNLTQAQPEPVQQAIQAVNDTVQQVSETVNDTVQQVQQAVNNTVQSSQSEPTTNNSPSAPVATNGNVSQLADTATQAIPEAAPVVQQVVDAVNSVPAIANAINSIHLP